MTNKEWAKENLIKEMNDNEELFHSLVSEYFSFKTGKLPWCDGCGLLSYGSKTCANCFDLWANSKYVNKMPKLKSGNFIQVKHEYSGNITTGVVVENPDGKLTVVYSYGTWDSLDEIKDSIIKVYNEKTNCFKACVKSNILWEK